MEGGVRFKEEVLSEAKMATFLRHARNDGQTHSDRRSANYMALISSYVWTRAITNMGIPTVRREGQVPRMMNYFPRHRKRVLHELWSIFRQGETGVL